LKLQANQVEEAKTIAASIKHSLPKSKRDAEVLRAAKVFDLTGDKQSAVDALKFRLANAKVPTAVALTDLAGYQREKGDLAAALKTIQESEAKLGNQRWLHLLQAETQHANGATAEAYALLHALPDTNEHRPDPKDLAFLPCNWQSMLDDDPSIEGLEQDLAFESGDYNQALTLSDAGANRVTGIEADYALGSRAEALRWLDSDVADEAIYVDPWTAVQVSEILLDAEQAQKAGEILMQALERYPQEHSLKFAASRQAALSGNWPTAEALFEQELPAITIEMPLVSAQAVCQARNLVKAAMATEHWQTAESWSKRLAAQQPKNQTAQVLRLQITVKALEFSALNQGLGIEKHILSAQKCEEVKAELAALIANLEALKTSEVEHWCARGKVVLEPNQANIRRLAMITPEADDIAAMMAALKNSGQVSTALQLGKKHENELAVLFAEADCLKSDDPHRAFETLEKALKGKNVSPAAYAFGAHLNMEQKEYYSAINQIEEALEYWPNEAGWQEYAAEAWQAVGDVQNSTAHLEKALQLVPDSMALQLKLGKNYLQAKELDRAIDSLKSVTKSAVNLPEGWEALAEAYYLSGQTEDALAAAQRAMDVDAFTVKPYLLSAQINLDQGNAAKALELSQKALQQDEKNPETMVVLAKAWLANGNKLQALHALEKVPQSKNVSVAQLIEHARLVKEINGSANAKGMLESLAERYPDNLDVLNMLAESQLANGDKANAEKSAQRSLKLQESQPQMQRFLGKLEFTSGHLDQAIYHYSQAVALDPANSEAYLELSKVYEQQRDYSAAVDTLNKALELQPEDLSAVLAAANLMRSAKDYGKAEAYLRRAAEIAPSDLNVRRQLGAVIALNLVESSQEASSHI
jgi:predicted Zn-dependent protease